MKSLLLFVPLSAALVSGCASPERTLVLDPVGPAPLPLATNGLKGALVVFSAFEVVPRSAIFDSDVREHSDYRIFSEDGKLLRTVRNSSGTMWEGPTQVELAAGNYRIVARANGYGLVTVPVVVMASRVTTLHLEGGGSWPNKTTISRATPVRLPDGQIVGWRAVPTDIFHP